MYKVGDEVLVKGKITNVEGVSVKYYDVEFNSYAASVSENELVSDKTYEKGLEDAWSLARKIILTTGFSVEELYSIFGCRAYESILRNFTAEEALAKIEAYKKEKEIKVNSIVENSMGVLGVVTRDENTNVYVMWTDGSCGKREKKCLKNTGRTANTLTALLRQIKE